jgi:AAA ATPase domain
MTLLATIPTTTSTFLARRVGIVAVSTDNAAVSRAGASPLTTLWGRQREQAEMNQVLLDVRSGRSRVLVVRGEAGIGKTALMEYLAGAVGECRVARTAGVESEMELAYAGLHQFCGSMFGCAGAAARSAA